MDAPWSYSDPEPKNPRSCVSCGRAIAWDANVCPYCGHDFRKGASASPVGQSTPQAQMRGCVACGRAIAWDVNVCPYCGHDYRPQMAGPQPMYGQPMYGQPMPQKTGKSFQGSILALVLLIFLCWPAAIIYYLVKRE